MTIPERILKLYGKDERLFKEITIMIYSQLVEFGVENARDIQKQWIHEWNNL